MEGENSLRVPISSFLCMHYINSKAREKEYLTRSNSSVVEEFVIRRRVPLKIITEQTFAHFARRNTRSTKTEMGG